MGGTLDTMRARILACYTNYKVEDLPLQKSEETEIEKGGEGSKGGKVIGHTKSGKPIYANSSHDSHKKFTEAEHEDARNTHMKEEVTKRTMTERDEAAAHHGRMADKIKKSEDNEELQKGREATNFGHFSKDGKYIKTTQGWKRAELAPTTETTE